MLRIPICESQGEGPRSITPAGRPGKVKVVPTKPCVTADDLSLAYSPGVAAPCLEIEKNPEDAYKYTAKGNLVAVLSATARAVLGLGNIGALAGKPVMEGKGVLFKRFADIDVFDIEVDSVRTRKEMIRFCEMIAPDLWRHQSRGHPRARVLRDRRARCKESLDIPVFHDDQHGTAIISAAALLNGRRAAGQEDRGREGRLLGRRRVGDLLREALQGSSA